VRPHLKKKKKKRKRKEKKENKPKNPGIEGVHLSSWRQQEAENRRIVVQAGLGKK
jgi:hypothetical protein